MVENQPAFFKNITKRTRLTHIKDNFLHDDSLQLPIVCHRWNDISLILYIQTRNNASPLSRGLHSVHLVSYIKAFSYLSICDPMNIQDNVHSLTNIPYEKRLIHAYQETERKKHCFNRLYGSWENECWKRVS